MHSSSVRNLERFFETYLSKFKNPEILDIGGTKLGDHTTGLDILKNLIRNSYRTVDIKAGPSVDIVLKSLFV